MTEDDFNHFCHAMSQSCARQANALLEKARSLPPDAFEQNVRLERRADTLRDFMEVFAYAPEWWNK